MKELRKAISFLLTFTIVLSVGITAFAELIDINTHWANKEISYFVEKGILNGYPDGTFKPENYVTKAEIYKIINKVMGYTEVAEVNFLDLKESDWFYQDVAKGLKAGYITEEPGGNLMPKASITRGEVALIIGIAYGLSKDESISTKVFLDENEMKSEVKEFVSILRDKGYISGYPDGTFKPDGFITRAEVAKIINNISSNPISKEEETKLVLEKVQEKEVKYIKEKPREDSGSSSGVIIHEPDPIPQIVPVVEVENITVSSDVIVLMLGGLTGELTAYVYPENATDKSVTWSTSNANVINVVDGVLTPVGIGVATITAQAGDKIATTRVTVECLVTSITVEGVDGIDTITKIGGKLQMIASVTPNELINKAVTWSIVNGASSATINSSGIITALANGTVTVRAKAKDGSGIIGEKEIIISGQSEESIEVTEVKLNSNTLSLSVDGSQKTLTAIVLPTNATNKKVKWSSSNEEVATVSSIGQVTPIAAGTATITVTTEDCNRVDSCQVTVTLLTARITFLIKDKNGKPIVDALIKIDNNTLITDISGIARIILKRASYPYSVSKGGYVTIEDYTAAREGKVENIILQEEPITSP